MTLSLILAKGGILDPIAKPLAAVLAFFYSLVPNYGIAIILLTIAMMLLLTPLTIKQTRSMLVMQKLQPEMKKLQEQHKNDRQALNEAVMALYKEHNASPLGGCLPMLLPFPLFIALLRVLEGLSHTVKGVSQPKYLTAHTKMAQDIVKAHGQLDAFGMNLAKSARNVGGGFAHSLPFFILLLVMIGTQFYQQYQLTSRNPAAAQQPGQAMMKFIPLFFGVISINFPAGVVLYWTVSNIIRIGQQWALYRYDPKVKALVAKDVQEIEAKTREIDAKEGKPQPQPRPKPAGRRSSFRDLLKNAAEAGADRKAPRGKSATSPNTKSSGAKPGAAGRPGVRPQPAKATPGTSGGGKTGTSGGGKPGSLGAGKRPMPQKGGPAKGLTPKNQPAKGSTPAKAGGGGAKGSTPAPAKQGPGGANAGPVKPGAPRPTVKPGAAARGVGAGKPDGAAKPAGAGNGGAPKAAAAAAKSGAATAPAAPRAPGNGATNPANNGTTASQDGSGQATSGAGTGNGAPAKGRTGAGGARTGGGTPRTVSSRRRRRGR